MSARWARLVPDAGPELMLSSADLELLEGGLEALIDDLVTWIRDPDDGTTPAEVDAMERDRAAATELLERLGELTGSDLE